MQDEKFNQIPTQPVAKRDITVTLPVGTPAKEAYSKLTANQPKICEGIRLIDTYATDTEVKYTFHLTFRHPERSLSDEEVNEQVAKLETLF